MAKGKLQQNEHGVKPCIIGKAGCIELPLCKPTNCSSPQPLAYSRHWELSYVITKWLRNKTKATGFWKEWKYARAGQVAVNLQLVVQLWAGPLIGEQWVVNPQLWTLPQAGYHHLTLAPEGASERPKHWQVFLFWYNCTVRYSTSTVWCQVWGIQYT